MNCFITDMREKEVINLNNGYRFGNVCDIEFDTCSGCIVAIIIYGKSKCFGLMGRYDDIRICWQDIKVIGDDTILVDFECPENCKRCNNGGFFESLFNHKQLKTQFFCDTIN